MTNLDRLKLELGNKDYYSNEEFSIFLEEHGLNSLDLYNNENNYKYLLETVVSVLESLCNNIYLFMNVSTEFTTSTSAYENLQNRIDKINKKILKIKEPNEKKNTITYLYFN